MFPKGSVIILPAPHPNEDDGDRTHLDSKTRQKLKIWHNAKIGVEESAKLFPGEELVIFEISSIMMPNPIQYTTKKYTESGELLPAGVNT